PQQARGVDEEPGQPQRRHEQREQEREEIDREQQAQPPGGGLEQPRARARREPGLELADRRRGLTLAPAHRRLANRAARSRPTRPAWRVSATATPGGSRSGSARAPWKSSATSRR